MDDFHLAATYGPVIPQMNGPDGKLRRAREHLQTLHNEITRARRLDNHTITVEDDVQACEYVFRVHNVRDADPNWSYLIGDCVHNLRSALDHLVYQLSIRKLGRDLTEEEGRRVGFPIEEKPARFPRPDEGRLEHVRIGEYTRIAELQPYNAWDYSIWGVGAGVVNQSPAFAATRRPPYLWNPGNLPMLLQYLARLDNVDKHRLVHTAHRVAAYHDGPDPPIPGHGSSYPIGPLVNGAEVCRWRYDPPRPELPSDMDMEAYFPLDVAFDSPLIATPAVQVLEKLSAATEIVLEIFRPCVVDGGPPFSLTGR